MHLEFNEIAMMYELINPSDPIVFEADNDKVAQLSALFVGNGKHGVTEYPKGRKVLPVLIMGWRQWWLDTHDQESPEESLLEVKEDIVKCMRSFKIKDDGERSSMNDICGRASESADGLEKTEE